MSDIIEIRNLSFRYPNKLVFENLNLNIRDGEWLAIVGPNGSGKSTLIRILVGLLEADGKIIIDNLNMIKENLIGIRKKIGLVFENTDDSFVGETVADDIAFALENLAYSPKQMKEVIDDIAAKLKIENILEKDPKLLSGGEKQKVALAAALVTNPKILIIDDALEMVDYDSKKEILSIINDLHKEKKITIITVTHNLEETYNADRMMVVNNGKILIDGPVKDVLLEDKIFNRIGIEVPFMIDLSIKLKLYGILDCVIIDMDEMVNALWK